MLDVSDTEMEQVAKREEGEKRARHWGKRRRVSRPTTRVRSPRFNLLLSGLASVQKERRIDAKLW